MYLDNADHLDSCREGEKEKGGGEGRPGVKADVQKKRNERLKVIMWHAMKERNKEKEESGIDGKKENEWEEPIKLQ